MSDFEQSNDRSETGGSGDAVLVCRCEGVTLGQVKRCIQAAGARSVNQVKKLTRAGMGPCQGRTCAGLVEKILSNETGVSRGAEPYYARSPLRGVPLQALAACADRFVEPQGPAGAVMLRPEEQKSGGKPEGVEGCKRGK